MARKKSRMPMVSLALSFLLLLLGVSMYRKHLKRLDREKEQQRLAVIEASKEDLRDQLIYADAGGDTRARHEIVVRLMEYEPDDAELWLARLETLGEMEQWQRLRENLANAPEAAAADPVLLPARARMAAVEENLSEEKELWMELAGRTDVGDELRRQGFREWCGGLRRDRQWSQLKDATSDWLTWEPTKEPLLLRVEVSLNSRDFAKARVDLDAARALDGTKDSVRRITAVVERGELLAEELVKLDAAVAANQRDPQALMKRGLAILKAGFRELAMPDLEAAQRLAPGSAAVKILYEFGLCLNGGWEVKGSPVIIKWNRWDYSWYDRYPYDLYQVGDQFRVGEDGILLLELLALEIAEQGQAPTDEGLQLRVDKLIKLGQFELAVRLARPRAMRDGASADHWNFLLSVYKRSQLWQEGERVSLQVTERFPEDGFAWRYLGIFRLQQFDYRGAMTALDRSLELLDNYEDMTTKFWRELSLRQLEKQ